jgi:DNA modification methylase
MKNNNGLGKVSDIHLYNMDFIDGMNLITDKSVDLIFCDFPYG